MRWVRGVNWHLEPASAWERDFHGEENWVIVVVPDSVLLRGGYLCAEPQRLAALVQRVGRERGWSRPLLEPYQLLWDEGDTEAWARCYHPALGAARQNVYQLNELPTRADASIQLSPAFEPVQTDLFLDVFGPNAVP